MADIRRRRDGEDLVLCWGVVINFYRVYPCGTTYPILHAVAPKDKVKETAGGEIDESAEFIPPVR